MTVHKERRAVLRGGLLAAAGATLGVTAAVAAPKLFGWDRPPLGGGYASADDTPTAVARPNVSVRYYVQTTEPVVAFTFDDGPGPQWTPMVLDVLDAARVPATFFMVGRRTCAWSREAPGDRMAAIHDADRAGLAARYADVITVRRGHAGVPDRRHRVGGAAAARARLAA